MSHDLSALVPNTFRVVFPRTLDGIPQDSVYIVDTTLSSLALSQYPVGFTGHSGVKTVRSSCTAVFTTAGGGTPTNDSELNALATQLATDWYIWQLGRSDIVYADIVPYTPTGYADTIEWSYDHDTATTRVQRKPWREMESTLPHYSVAGSSVVIKCCCNIYCGGGNTYIIGDTYFTGNVYYTGTTVDYNITNFNLTSTNTTIEVTDLNIINTAITITNTDVTFTNTSTITVNIPIYYIDTDDSTSGGDNYNPGTTPVITVTPTTNTTVITGLVPTDVTKDEIRYIINDSNTFNLFLSPNDSSSNTTNRFYRVNDVPYRIPPGQGVIVKYDSDITNWFLLSPPQPNRNHTFETTITTSTNDLDVQQAEVVIITPDTGDQTVTGLAEVLRGAPFIIENGHASNNLILANGSGSSASGNRFDCGSGGDDTITAGGMRTCMYDDENEVIKVVPSGGSGSGEANSGSNVGGAAGVYKDKSGTTLRFRSLAGSEGVSATESTNTVSIKMNIGGLSADTIAPEDDYIAFLDNTSGTHKKTLGSDFLNSGYNGLDKFNAYLTEYTDWSTASTTNTVTIATYGARTHVDKVFARVKTAFGGGSISALDYTITLESTGESSASDTPFGGLTPAETAHRVSIADYCGSYTNTTSLKVTVTATGGNLNTLTSGALELWVVHRTLPVPT